MRMTFNARKYILVFVLTCLIFLTVFSVSNYINNKKIREIKLTEDKIAIDILSLETQFALLQEASCKKIQGTILSDELNSLGDRLSYAESQGIQDENVTHLKKYYSILQIKDYLLTRKIATRCPSKEAPIHTILYFYSNKTSCSDCTKTGFVLTRIRESYPNVRVYSFDYDIDLNAVSTLLSIYEVPNKLPVLVINEKAFSGYKTIEELQGLLKLAPIASSTRTMP